MTRTNILIQSSSAKRYCPVTSSYSRQPRLQTSLGAPAGPQGTHFGVYGSRVGVQGNRHRHAVAFRVWKHSDRCPAQEKNKRSKTSLLFYFNQDVIYSIDGST